MNRPEHNFLTFQGPIHLILNNEDLTAVIKELHSASVLGFDTETRPSFKKGEVYQVALLQLATETAAYLIRLHYISEFQAIKKLFENKEIIKVGVAIRDDLKGLQKIFSFNPENFIELQDVARKKGLQNAGLKGMTEEVLGASLSKRAKTSNWESPIYTESQIKYAATDAWVGLQLYKEINQKPDLNAK